MKTYTGFTIEFLESIGVCGEGLARVRAFGGEIQNTPAGWHTYIAAYPEAWTAPVFMAQYLISRCELDSDFIWQIARIPFRECGKIIPTLAQYAKTLNADSWREAADAATEYADSATSFAEADAARDAESARDAAARAVAARFAAAAAAHAARADSARTLADFARADFARADAARAAAANAIAAAHAGAARAHAAGARAGASVKAEIVDLAVAALSAY